MNHPFVTMAHMADYAHCSNVKSSAQKMEICKRSPVTPAQTHAAAATLMAAGVRSGNVTLTFNNQLSRSAASVVNGRAVLERSAAYDAHFQAASAAQLVPGALLPVPSYPAASPTGNRGAVVAVGGGLGQVYYIHLPPSQSSDPQFIEWKVRFTTVPLNNLPDQLGMSYSRFSALKLIVLIFF